MSFLRTRISKVFGSFESSQDKDAGDIQRQRAASRESAHRSTHRNPAATKPINPAQNSLLELFKAQVFSHHSSPAASTPTSRRNRAQSINNVASIKIKDLSESIRAKTHMFYSQPNASTSTRVFARSQASLSSKHSQRSEARSSLRSRRGGQCRCDGPREALNNFLPLTSEKTKVERHEIDVSIPTSGLLEESSTSNLKITMNGPPASPARRGKTAGDLRLDTSQTKISDSNAVMYERERSSTSGTESFHLSPSTASAFLLSQSIPERLSSRSNRSDSVHTNSSESRASVNSRASSFLALPSDIDSLLTLADSKRSSRHGSLFVKGNHDEQLFTISPYRKAMRNLKTGLPRNNPIAVPRLSGIQPFPLPCQCPEDQEKSLTEGKIKGTSDCSDSSKLPKPPHVSDTGKMVFTHYQAYAESSSGDSEVPSPGSKTENDILIDYQKQHKPTQAMSVETESDTETDASLSLRSCHANPAKSSSKGNHLEATANVRDDFKRKSNATPSNIRRAVSLLSLSPYSTTRGHITNAPIHCRKPSQDVLSPKVIKLAVDAINKINASGLELPKSLQLALKAIDRPIADSIDSSIGVVALAADKQIGSDLIPQTKPLQNVLSPATIKHAVEAINKINGYTLELPDSLRLAVEAIERPTGDSMESPLPQAIDDWSSEAGSRRQSLYDQIPDLALTGHDTLAESALRAAAVAKSPSRVSFSGNSPRRHLYHSHLQTKEVFDSESAVDLLSEVGSTSSGTEPELEVEDLFDAAASKASEDSLATDLAKTNIIESPDHSVRCASSQSIAITDSCATTTRDLKCCSPISASSVHRHSPARCKSSLDGPVLVQLKSEGEELGEPCVSNQTSTLEEGRALTASTPIIEPHSSTASTGKSEVMTVDNVVEEDRGLPIRITKTAEHFEVPTMDETCTTEASSAVKTHNRESREEIIPTLQDATCPLQPTFNHSTYAVELTQDQHDFNGNSVRDLSSISVTSNSSAGEMHTTMPACDDIEGLPLLPPSLDEGLDSGTPSFFASLRFPRTPTPPTPVGERQLWTTPGSDALRSSSAEKTRHNSISQVGWAGDDASWAQNQVLLEQGWQEKLASCVKLRAQTELLLGSSNIEDAYPLTQERLGVNDTLKSPIPVRLSSSTYSVISASSTRSFTGNAEAKELMDLPPLPPPTCITPYSTPRVDDSPETSRVISLPAEGPSDCSDVMRDFERHVASLQTQTGLDELHTATNTAQSSNLSNSLMTEADQDHKTSVQRVSSSALAVRRLSGKLQRMNPIAGEDRATDNDYYMHSFVAARLPRLELSPTSSDRQNARPRPPWPSLSELRPPRGTTSATTTATTGTPQDKEALITSSMKKGVWWQRDDEWTLDLADDELPEASPLASKANTAADFDEFEFESVDMIEVGEWVWVFSTEVKIIPKYRLQEEVCG